MRANPGGEIDPQDVVGRRRFIGRLWETLEHQSVILVAERRMGKSSVIKKMVAEAPAGRLTFYRDVESINSPLGFVERVNQDVQAHLSTLNRTGSRVREFLQQLAGIEVAGLVRFPDEFAPHWKPLLEHALEDLAEHQQDVVVLFWDELPLMLRNVARTTGEDAAMDLLDTLRSLRQMNPGLRMVFSGSIGLHHVAATLRDAGHANDSTNDMRTIELPPLADEDATFLASELIRGEELEADDTPATAAAIATAVDQIPFYIHFVVSAMKDRGDVAGASLAGEVVASALLDPQDPWHLQHYRERLSGYYGPDRLPVTLAVLDELAHSEEPLAFDALLSLLVARLDGASTPAALQVRDRREEPLRQLLTALQRDHYIVQSMEDGRYAFRFKLIGRWWRSQRGQS